MATGASTEEDTDNLKESLENYTYRCHQKANRTNNNNVDEDEEQ